VPADFHSSFTVGRSGNVCQISDHVYGLKHICYQQLNPAIIPQTLPWGF